MGLDTGGYEQRPNWPKMGLSLLMATCLILAVRTAKQPAIWDTHNSSTDLDAEIAYSARLAGRVLAVLVGHHPAIFPTRKEPWYQASDDEVPK